MLGWHSVTAMPQPPATDHSPDDRPAPDNGGPDDAWFRAPTRREHAIGAALFIGFGLFFVALFVVLAGWWFRWVILGLGGVSVLRGLRHLAALLAGPRTRDPANGDRPTG